MTWRMLGQLAGAVVLGASALGLQGYIALHQTTQVSLVPEPYPVPSPTVVLMEEPTPTPTPSPSTSPTASPVSTATAAGTLRLGASPRSRVALSPTAPSPSRGSDNHPASWCGLRPVLPCLTVDVSGAVGVR